MPKGFDYPYEEVGGVRLSRKDKHPRWLRTWQPGRLPGWMGGTTTAMPSAAAGESC